MRVLEIIKPLYEFAPPESEDGSINLISNLLTMVLNHELEGEAYDRAVELLVDLENTAEQVEANTVVQEPQPQPQAQPQPQPQPQPQELDNQPEEEPIAEAIRNYTTALNKLLARVKDPSKWNTLVAAKRAKGISDQDIYDILEGGVELHHQEIVEWDDDLATTAKDLADKIVKNGDIIHNAIENNKRKDNDKDYKVNKLHEAISPKKESPMKNKIVEILKNIFEAPPKNQKDLGSRNRKKLLVKKFMEQCKVGIIDFNDIIEYSGPNATIDGLVEARDEEIYYEIRDGAFSAVPSTTAGAWGPGEIGLSLLATPVTKGNIGDLAVMTPTGKIEVELKGMQEATAGGRFNSNGVAKAKDAAREFKKIYKEAFDSLVEIINQNLSKKDQIKDINSIFSFVQKNGKMKIKRPETFDKQAIDNIWNPKLVLPASRIDPTATKFIMEKFLRDMADCAVLEEGKQYARRPIDQMIKDKNIFRENSEGGFELNFVGIQSNICKILYSVYAGVDKKGVIMYFNTVTSNYYIVQGPDDMKKQLLSGSLQTGNAIIDFAAGQSPASPQVGIA